ncbi:MAG: hypothetical protein JWM19_1813 [Actinomycetia bacterium]|nr:hypothetical protein [Actinomycetes bacterium]
MTAVSKIAASVAALAWRRWATASATTVMTTGSKIPDAYFVAFARARIMPATTSTTTRTPGFAPAERTPSQVATASNMSAMASYVARAPRNAVDPSPANIAAAKKAAMRLPNIRRVTPCNRIVASNMKTRLRRRAPATPPRPSATAPTGG